jgi:hypothetical protein
MKILIVTPACHYTNTGATQNDIYACIGILKSMGHDVALASLGSPQQNEEILKNIGKKYQVAVNIFTPQGSAFSWLKHALKELALFDRSAYPFALLTEDPAFQNYVATFAPDAVIGFISSSWPVIRFCQRRGTRGILRSHTFEPIFYWETLRGIAKINPLNWLRFFAKLISERKAIMIADVTLTLPIVEIRFYRFWNKSAVQALALLFPGEHIGKPWVHEDKKPLDVFYLGASYNVIFHLEGAQLLIEKIAPQVHSQAPGAFRFHILGAKLPANLVSQCDAENTIYEGYVADLNAFLQKMDIGAFPVFTGSVIKGKVSESLARLFPVVVTSNCLGTYTLETGKHLLVADNMPDFVEAILKLRDDDLRLHLSTGAYEFAVQEFGHENLKRIITAALSDKRI